MSPQLSNTCLLLLLVIVIPSRSFAGEQEKAIQASRLQMATERVIVFKDGYCLIVKKGTATTDANGRVFTDEVPDSAILGSFWAIPDRGTIKSMVAGWVETKSETKREVNCTNVVEIIKANLGKKCSFAVDERENVVEGTILKILSNDDLADLETFVAEQQPNLRHFVHALSPPVETGSQPRISVNKTTGSHFILRTENGDVMIPTGSVRNLTIEEMNSRLEQTVTEETRHKRLSLNFGEANSKIEISLMYFRPDVRWIPTYRIDLTEEQFVMHQDKHELPEGKPNKTAEIFMQGEILNEAEDFTDVPFHVVVGVPNFRFRSIPSPMVLESSLRNLLVQAAPSIMGGQDLNSMSNALYTQRSGEFRSNRAAGSEERVDVELPGELTGQGGNDLFVYELEKMTLRKGERATVPILRTKVPYRDIYTWDIMITHSETYAASSADSPSPLVLTENKVWRQIEMINDTDIPWTTGAAMFVKGFQPLAQELLTYTSPGGICRVPVTVAVDLQGRVENSETNRELKALKWRGYDYAKVFGKIAVELANNKTETVPVEVKLRFGGKANKASLNGKISLEAFRNEDWHHHNGDAINNSSVVRWKTNIEPGECFKPVVEYEFLLRH